MEYGRRIGTVRYGRLELAWEQQRKHKKTHIRHSIGTRLANKVIFLFRFDCRLLAILSSRPVKRSLIYTQKNG